MTTPEDPHAAGQAVAAGLVALDPEASRQISDAVERHLQTQRAQLLTAAQAAEILGVSTKSFRRLADRLPRQLPARYVVDDARWLRRQVEEYAERSTTAKPARGGAS